MKVSDLRSLLKILTEALSNQAVTGSTPAVLKLCKELDPFDDKSILDIAKALSRFDKAAVSEREQKIGDVIPAIAALYSVLRVAGKSSDAKQMEQLLGLFTKYPNVSLSILSDLIKSPARTPKPRRAADPANMTAVNDYLVRLQAVLGKDEEFMDLYQALKNDKEMGKGEMVALADLFMGPVKPTTSRPKALEAILSRHRKLVDFV